MKLKIALAGNPNCGKTTLFNILTGSNQYVGNWPGVTVEKKEGKLKKSDDVIVTDLPGIYSLSPYTLEEVVARNYLIDERPDAILNVVDGTNIERNLYLTTQLIEIGVPVVVAINMMDVVTKSGDRIDTKRLSEKLGVPVVEISALKGTGTFEAADEAIRAAKEGKIVIKHNFSGSVEHAIAHIEEEALHDLPEERQRWYAIKIFERDKKVLEKLALPENKLLHIESDIVSTEKEMDDDAEGIIANERYEYITRVLSDVYCKNKENKLSVSEKIDRVVTNRVLALPIFIAVMLLVYTLSIGTVGDKMTSFVNNNVFGDGWFFLGMGRDGYENAVEEYESEREKAMAYADSADSQELSLAVEQNDYAAASAFVKANPEHTGVIEGQAGEDIIIEGEEFLCALEKTEPNPSDFGPFVEGIPTLVTKLLEKINVQGWLQSLIVDGIVGGVGAVLGFVPQMVILFLLLSLLEDCGYMSRIAFIMDRIFRKFGLSGKSFIPLLVATGCGVPGILASRTIEQERDRRMTIMTTGFIPCGAKMPIVAFIAGALFGGSALVAVSAYFIGIGAVIVSGLILKKTKMFSGDPAPFVMELPSYHAPVLKNTFRTTFDRAWSFVKRAGTVILAASVIIWLLNSFSFTGGFHFITEANGGRSVLEFIGSAIAFVFIPLGFGRWETAVATILGLVAKEEVVGVFGSLSSMSGDALEAVDGGDYTTMGRIGSYFFNNRLEAFSFMIFNLLCAPCFAAMGAIRREMNSAKWTAFTISYMCAFAYAISLIVYQLGLLFTGAGFGVGTVAAFVVLALLVYLIFRKNKNATKRVKG